MQPQNSFYVLDLGVRGAYIHAHVVPKSMPIKSREEDSSSSAKLGCNGDFIGGEYVDGNEGEAGVRTSPSASIEPSASELLNKLDRGLEAPLGGGP
jgi:hypothetical protein